MTKLKISPVEDETPKLFPVRILRGYHPVSDFLINGEVPDELTRVKVRPGMEIELPVDEAKTMIAKGIAVRNDPIG